MDGETVNLSESGLIGSFPVWGQGDVPSVSIKEDGGITLDADTRDCRIYAFGKILAVQKLRTGTQTFRYLNSRFHYSRDVAYYLVYKVTKFSVIPRESSLIEDLQDDSDLPDNETLLIAFRHLFCSNKADFLNKYRAGEQKVLAVFFNGSQLEFDSWTLGHEYLGI